MKYSGKLVVCLLAVLCSVFTARAQYDKDGFYDILSEQSNVDTYQVYNLYATYEHSWAGKHNFKALGGYNYEQQSYGKIYTDGYDLSSNYISAYALMPSADAKVSDEASEYAIAGFFGRLNYDYEGKYLLEVSARADGTSRFPEEKRWGVFPSASAGWKFTDERFMEWAKDVLNYGKIRFSYGWLGNQQVKDYMFARKITLENSGWLFDSDSTQPKKAHAEDPTGNAITWEEKFEWDVRYVDSVSFLGDWSIILQTVKTVLSHEGISSGTSVTMEEFMGSGDEESSN